MTIFQKADYLTATITETFRLAKLAFTLLEVDRSGQHIVVLTTRRYLVSEDTTGNELFLMHEWGLGDEWENWTQQLRFTAFPDFGAVLHDLVVNPPYSADTEGMHGPPAYVHYDIDFMDDRFKKRFLQHLEQDISGHADDYLRKYFREKEWARIRYWREMLRMPNNRLSSPDSFG